jgi:hypothetical protein
MNHAARNWLRTAGAVALIALSLALAACQSSSKGSAESAGKSAAASVTANPQFIQAKALVKHCFAGTPTQQYQQVKLVFLSSKTGKNGDKVVAARAKLSSCMGISRSDEQPFFNEAVTAAEHQKPRIVSLHPVAGIKAFFTGTLPPIVIKYSNAPGMGGTMSPSPSTTGASA